MLRRTSLTSGSVAKRASNLSVILIVIGKLSRQPVGLEIFTFFCLSFLSSCLHHLQHTQVRPFIPHQKMSSVVGWSSNLNFIDHSFVVCASSKDLGDIFDS